MLVDMDTYVHFLGYFSFDVPFADIDLTVKLSGRLYL